MQVFIKRSDLTLSGPIRVLGYYDDGAAIDAEAHGHQATLLSLGAHALEQTLAGPMLMPGWREASRERIVQAEAERRILAAFPERAQREAALELAVLAVNGPAHQWPKEAKRRGDEIMRAFAYVKEVRQAARAMQAKAPSDPTDHRHWPVVVVPYKAD